MTELESCIRSIQQGEVDQLPRLIELTQVRLFRYCILLTGNREAAQDICQEALIKAMDSLHRLKKPESYFTWLFRMTKNLFIDRVRVSREHETLDESIATSSMDSETRDTVLRVRQAMMELSDDERQVILLVDLEGYSYAETAEIMELSEDGVRARLQRARRRFSEKFDTVDDTNPEADSSHR
jgi:RNA polymerase sigma-70 factor, ECF subfamily